MGLMKRYAEDRRYISARAVDAALQPTAGERHDAITAVFRECGEAARAYADQEKVTVKFVQLAVREFMEHRIRTSYTATA